MESAKISGRGTADSPIRRGGSCSYRGCEHAAVMTRITSGGYFVAYCRMHEREAADRFEREHELDA